MRHSQPSRAGCPLANCLHNSLTGGANACGQGYSGPCTQMISTRKSARSCGTVTVSDHFAAWEIQGWKLGGVASIHINAEVGGDTGEVEFSVANVTTTGK